MDTASRQMPSSRVASSRMARSRVADSQVPNSQVPRASGWLLTGLLTLWGVGAIGGGFFLASAPDGSGLGFDPAILDGTPFPDFLVPGLILFTLGVAAVVAATWVAVAIRHRYLPRRLLLLLALVALGINAWILGEVAFLWTVVTGMPTADRQVFYGFWLIYVPLSLAIAGLVARVARARRG